MPGDNLIADPFMDATRAISIEAQPNQIFPWLVQMGFGRAGWYSYDWIDNLGRRSASTILPQHQSLAAGELVPSGPIQFTASVVEQDKAIVLDYRNQRLEFTLAFRIDPVGPSSSRLVSRARARIHFPGGTALAKLLEIGDGIMVRKQLLNVKQRAETLT